MSFNLMATLSVHSDFGAQENKVFSSSLLSAIRVVLSGHLRLLIFLLQS